MVAPNGPCSLLIVTDIPILVTACFAYSKSYGSDISNCELHTCSSLKIAPLIDNMCFIQFLLSKINEYNTQDLQKKSGMVRHLLWQELFE